MSGRFASGFVDGISMHCLGNKMRVDRRKGICFALPLILSGRACFSLIRIGTDTLNRVTVCALVAFGQVKLVMTFIMIDTENRC